MVGFLAYGADRNIARIATVAGFAIGVDTAVGKVGCILECHIRIRVVVTLQTVVIGQQVGRQMGRQLPSGSDVTVVARHAIAELRRAQGRVVYHGASEIDGVEVAGPAILRGRYVVGEFPQADHIVVAVGAGRLRAVKAEVVIEAAGGKGARCMAVPAITVIGRGWYSRVCDGGRHMGINQCGAV